MGKISQYLHEALGMSQATQNRILISLLIIQIITGLRLITLRIVWSKTENVKIRYAWRRTISFTFPFIGLILVAAVWTSLFTLQLKILEYS